MQEPKPSSNTSNKSKGGTKKETKKGKKPVVQTFLNQRRDRMQKAGETVPLQAETLEIDIQLKVSARLTHTLEHFLGLHDNYDYETMLTELLADAAEADSFSNKDYRTNKIDYVNHLRKISHNLQELQGAIQKGHIIIIDAQQPMMAAQLQATAIISALPEYQDEHTKSIH